MYFIHFGSTPPVVAGSLLSTNAALGVPVLHVQRAALPALVVELYEPVAPLKCASPTSSVLNRLSILLLVAGGRAWS